MKVIKPPLSITEYLIEDTIFLAGSIEMGVAENWQEKVERLLKDTAFVIFNPRRDDWDSSWKQEKQNLQFREQVEWELYALENCKTIIMYFDINTKSPISLLELGLFARTKKMIVICPDGFYRKGNVDIVCERYGIKQCNTIEEAIDFIKYGSYLEREEEKIMGILRDTYIYVDSNKNAIYAQNNILDKQNNILEQNHQEEMKVKDRVDISKTEYLDLLEKAEKLKDMQNIERSFYNKLAKAIKTDINLLKARDIESETRQRCDIFGKDLIVKFTFWDCDLEREE